MQSHYEPTSVAVDASLKAESLLLQELRYLSKVAFQINKEISSTYNTYLLIVGIIAMAVGGLQFFVYDLRYQEYVKIPFFLDAATIVALLFGGILSFIFLLRFLQLIERDFQGKEAVNKIRAFYVQYLKSQLPKIEEVFYTQDEKEYFSNVPSYVLYTIFLVTSLSFSGACYILLNYAALYVFLVFDNLFWVICVFIISLFLQQWYYQRYLLKFRATPSTKSGASEQMSSVVQR